MKKFKPQPGFTVLAHKLALDRAANAGHNLVALAARTTGTGVAGDLDNAVEAESKPRGADRKTRATRPRRKAGTGRTGGTIPSPRAGKETGDRQQDTGAQTRAPVRPLRTIPEETPGLLGSLDDQSNGSDTVTERRLHTHGPRHP
ncbi:hypothetical protein [Streptomyces sp. NBC_01594]|uniref:hypothetical protein n=1 Tax=Streptomyces sp. NBC_01594 TaxID=2975890 RepID=UPI00386F0247